MTVFLTILLVLAMLGTLTVLGFGVATLLRGGDRPEPGRQDAAAKKPSPAGLFALAVVDRRPTGWLELLLQAARTQDDASRLG